MNVIETTITEHIYNQAIAELKAEGEAKAEARGMIRGQLRTLNDLYDPDILSQEQYRKMAVPLRKKLRALAKS